MFKIRGKRNRSEGWADGISVHGSAVSPLHPARNLPPGPKVQHAVVLLEPQANRPDFGEITDFSAIEGQHTVCNSDSGGQVYTKVLGEKHISRGIWESRGIAILKEEKPEWTRKPTQGELHLQQDMSSCCCFHPHIPGWMTWLHWPSQRASRQPTSCPASAERCLACWGGRLSGCRILGVTSGSHFQSGMIIRTFIRN